MSSLWNVEGKSGELASSFPHFSNSLFLGAGLLTQAGTEAL